MTAPQVLSIKDQMQDACGLVPPASYITLNNRPPTSGFNWVLAMQLQFQMRVYEDDQCTKQECGASPNEEKEGELLLTL